MLKAGQIGPRIDHRTNDMRVINSNLRLAQAKTRRNAYEIPTWAIADAIRRRTNKAKAAGPGERPPSLPQTPPAMPEVTVPRAIAVAAHAASPERVSNFALSLESQPHHFAQRRAVW